MQRPGPWILVLVASACAQGSLEVGGSSLGLSASATQVTTVADTGDDASSGSAAAEATSIAESGGESETSPTTTTPATEGSSSGAVESSSSGALEESSSGAPVTTMGVETSSDDGTPPPPDTSAWGSCDEADCEAGNDCLNITGLREYSPWCSPQCVADLDCPAPPDGDAYIGCLASGEGEEDPTNCVLVCEYDGLDYGTCPTGMACAAVPDQATPISLCMWP